MQEFFFTVLAIWVIWKLFTAFNNSRSREASQQFQQTNHHHHYHQKQEGDVTIQQKKSAKKPGGGDDAEYVDYEEIK